VCFLLLALLRQSDPHWIAGFFITDDSVFDSRLQEILSIYNDPRLRFIDVPMEYRPKVKQMLISFFAFIIFNF